MDIENESAEDLRNYIANAERKVKELKEKLEKLESDGKAEVLSSQPREAQKSGTSKWPLTGGEYIRYGRQIIVPSIGIEGQLRLHATSVLIVGIGGLGCPAAAYIAGAGVKSLGIVDGDTVELSNLHRQILHNVATIGMWKVDSAIQYLQTLNPNVKFNAYREHLTPENAINIISQYDIVLDCTDNPKPRYLISDTCILLSKPLVSASALRTDAQLMVLNYPPRPAGDPTGGPCYRCVFPKPPPADQIVSCSDGGILGPVVGVMGVIQALEAIKLIASGINIEDTTISEFDHATHFPSPSLLIFSSNSTNNPFRVVRLRSRRPNCFACSAKTELTQTLLTSGSLDYTLFCGELTPVTILSPEERISAEEYAKLREARNGGHLLIDVREKVQFDICNIEGSINVPFSEIQGSLVVGHELDGPPDWLPAGLPPSAPIYVICKLGNDSQVATKKFKEVGLDFGGTRSIADIKGGFKAWREQVDRSWPNY